MTSELKRFLIIGNEELSASINRALNSINPRHFEYISVNPLESPNLDTLLEKLAEFKDTPDIRGIILTDILVFSEGNTFEISGIELIKHIRLTEGLGNLRALPLILCNFNLIMDNLKMKRDNIILLSSGCHPVQIPFNIDGFLSTIENLKYFGSFEDIRNEIKEYIVWSNEDDSVSKHDNFNRYGPFKLLMEHFGSLPEHLVKDYELMTEKIWFKKYQFLETQQILPSYTQEINEDEFKKIVPSKKVLYIDDEHRLGWSYALHSIVSGNNDENNYYIFQDSNHYIETPDNRFACIDNYEVANKLFETHNKSLTDALNEFSDAEDKKKLLTKEYSQINEKFKTTKNRLNDIQRKLENIKDNIITTKEVLDGIPEKTEKTIEEFFDEYGQEGKKLTDYLDKSKVITKLLEEYKNEHKLLSEYIEKENVINKELEHMKTDFKKLEEQFVDIKDKKAKSESRYRKADNELYPFQYDLIILDLRLEKIKDKEVLPYEISGIKLLNQIKQFDPSIPVLIFTASEKALNYKEAIGLGADGYWIKVVNSASDLKSEIVKCLKKAQYTRKLWLNIRKIEAKKELVSFYELPYKQSLGRKNIDEEDKNLIISFLTESFLLLQNELSHFERSVCNYDNYGKTAINMFLIQEIRYPGIKKEKYSELNRRGLIPNDEIEIKRIRNNAAHGKGKVSHEEAMKVFQKTLERCLMY